MALMNFSREIAFAPCSQPLWLICSVIHISVLFYAEKRDSIAYSYAIWCAKIIVKKMRVERGENYNYHYLIIISSCFIYHCTHIIRRKIYTDLIKEKNCCGRTWRSTVICCWWTCNSKVASGWEDISGSSKGWKLIRELCVSYVTTHNYFLNC
jgi:hypothetical protein